jgi:hypothetical protein
MATVDDNIGQALARIDQLIQDGQDFIEPLRDFENTTLVLDAPGSRTFSIEGSSAQLSELVNSPPQRPDDLDFVSPGNVADPPPINIRDTTPTPLPPAPSTAPEINIPPTPVINFPPPPTAPFIETVTTPDVPVIVLPNDPVTQGVTIPTQQPLTLPFFDQTFPEEELPFTPAPFNWSEPEFVNELLEELQTQTIDDLVNGGFGIDPRDEEQLVGRLRDREARTGRTGEAQVLRNFASRGHVLPSGALDDALRTTQQQTAATISAGEREIYVTRADLFRKTREFMMANGLGIVTMLSQLFGFRQERALKAAQFQSEIVITVFDALVRRYNTQISAYSAATQAHEVLIRAELAKIDIFKAEIEAQALILEINKQEVAIFVARINAVEATVRLFEAETRAAAIRADIERLKIQAFGEQVNAYIALVNAEKARIELYVAQIGGEEAKLEVFKTEVEVYATEVDAAKVLTQIQNLNVSSDIETAKLELGRYDGQIRQFQSNLQREIERLRATTTVYNTDVGAFSAQVDGWGTFYDAVDRNNEIFLRTITANAAVDVQITALELERQEKQATLQLTAAATGAEYYKELLGAAQSATSSLVVKEDVNA